MDKIDKLTDNLPKTEERIESAFNECSKERRVIQKIKTFIEVPNDSYKDYLDSALRALNAAKVLLESGNYEWVIVPSYSAIYQAGNAILIKELGKECKDHFCLLVSLLKLKKIGSDEVKDINYLKEQLEKLPDESISFASKLRLIRSSVIYKPSKDYDEKILAETVFNKAKNFVNNVMGIL